ncbi:hypothetical protein [Pseudoclavibacter helvolus]|uniref:hypothetical protein n=1 Tax=Pseudoclavibacter helvolus TaxID=255205 RepID=UPI00373613B3
MLYAHGWIVAVLIAGGVLILEARSTKRETRRSPSPRERLVLIVLGVGAAVVFAAQEIVRDQAHLLLVSSDWTTRFIWWKYVGPAVSLAVALVVGSLLLRGARRDVEVRVPPFAARGWFSFTRRTLLVWACAALSLLIVVALFAGANSSQAADGHFRLLILSGNSLHGNWAGWLSEGTDYFGWSYSGPTMATVAIVLRDMGFAGMPHGGIVMEAGLVLPIGGEFEALSKVLLLISALLRPIALACVLLGGTVGWLPPLIARRGAHVSRGAAQAVTEVGK